MKQIQTIVQYMEKHWLPIVIGTVLLTYGLIMVLAAGQVIWFDEAYSIMLARRPVGELLALTAVDAHPPLYYLYLKLWGSIFGWGEFALRSSSAVLAAASIGLVAALIRQLFSKRVALAILPFIVLAPFLLRYGYEIRMYMLASLIGLAATWTLLRAVKTENKTWWLLYAVLVALGMYTLYTTVVIWVAHVIWLIVIRYRDTHSIKAVLLQPAVAAYAGAVLLFSLYIPTFFHQMFNSALPGIGSPLTLVTFVGIIGQIVSYRPEWELTPLLSGLIIVLLGLAIYLSERVWSRYRKKQSRVLLLLATLLVVPLVFYALSSFFIYRYMAHIAIYWYISIGLIAVLGWSIARKAAIIYSLIVGILLISGIVHLYRIGNFNIERQQYPMTAQVRAQADCDRGSSVVVADDPYTYIDSHYYFDDCKLVFFSEKSVDFAGGYAPLADSDRRVASTDDICTNSDVCPERVVHLRWDGAEQAFIPDARYELVSSKTFGKQTVDEYTLVRE